MRVCACCLVGFKVAPRANRRVDRKISAFKISKSTNVSVAKFYNYFTCFLNEWYRF